MTNEQYEAVVMVMNVGPGYFNIELDDMYAQPLDCIDSIQLLVLGRHDCSTHRTHRHRWRSWFQERVALASPAKFRNEVVQLHYHGPREIFVGLSRTDDRK